MEKKVRERAQSQSGLHLWWSNPENGAWTKFWNGKTRVCLTRAGANWAQVSIRTPCSHKGNFPMIWLTSFRHASGIFFTGEMSGESSVGKQPYYDCCLENSVRNPHLRLRPRNKDKAERVGSFFVQASRETIMSGKKLRKQSPDRETSSVPNFASSLSFFFWVSRKCSSPTHGAKNHFSSSPKLYLTSSLPREETERCENNKSRATNDN